MLTPDPKWDWTKIIIFAVLSLFGGSLGYTMRTLDANEKISLWRVLLEGLSAVFFGVVIGVLCMENNVTFGYASALIALTSWIGSRATFLILRAIAYKKVGITPEVKRDGASDS